MRTTKSFPLDNPEKFKKQLFAWSRQFDEVAWLDSNNYQQENSSFDALLAVQAFTALKTDYHQAFDQLQEYQETTKDWIFGYLSYDLKNDVERLTSQNYDGLRFPDLYFFQPQKIIQVKGKFAEFHYLRMVDDEMDEDFAEILDLEERGERKEERLRNQEILPRISKEEYLVKINKMLSHIQWGDIYEANFCQEFYAENCQIQPSVVFSKLNEISGPPFATFLKLEQYYLLCASPERYLKKTGSKILSQPIKGTARRAENKEEDLKISHALANDPKEVSENVMIVDLVRNDLSKIAKKGSVQVEELCKVYSFKQVHQLISTISAQLENGIPAVETLRATFPMGSMTGAPKISAMKIIEELEETKRGLYSGAVGYFTPNGDFDFNVVIRSILYNAEDRYLSFSVGGAITTKSNPEKEYEECLLKAKAMREALSG
ncbi:anthranilate synthase component I family protein [Zunongwangia sp. F260]|uniref:Anthranilate synthase component I family protein n=1 Tax=Autumnicola lenta TaxID=3075593 RepID=A0ABU3CI17_9FLAO|nr:anthranilate synthase component I family protein [Zunongwangia sp. F260]MDT0645989.1 anthranilate synthase component I family protein [Zunongwangia sp. F260]